MGKKKIVVQVISSSSESESDDDDTKKKSKRGRKKSKKKKYSKRNNQDVLYHSEPRRVPHGESSLLSKLGSRIKSKHCKPTPCPGTDLNLPHAFQSMNERYHFEPVTQPDVITAKRDAASRFKYNRVPENVNEWIDDMMLAGLLNQENLASPNIAYQMIRYYPVVVFSTKGSRQGREATKIFDTMRKELSIKKDVIVEISLDNSHAGSKIYNDLLLLTQMRGLPQVFIGETFVGGLDALKKLKKFKRVGPMILEAIGYTKWPCKLCEMEDHKIRNNKLKSDRKKFMRNALFPAH